MTTGNQQHNRGGLMRRCLGAFVAGLALTAIAGGPALADAHRGAKHAWTAEGFAEAESAAHDADSGTIYVSNVAGAPFEPDGEGYISRLDESGKVLERKWVSGLQGPTGVALHGTTLYVADIDTLHAIDTEAGAVRRSWTVASAKTLNDVAVDAKGRVYVSDMMDNAIYRLADGRFTQWLKTASLMTPNGLLATEDKLVVAAWGLMTGKGFNADPAGHLRAVDYKTKQVHAMGPGTPVGNLDGVKPHGDSHYLVTDWMNGKLLRIGTDGAVRELLDLDQGAADLEYAPEAKLVLIPMMNSGTVRAYTLK